MPGGDLTFHELCAELEIGSEIYLPLPIDDFRQIVANYGGNWLDRFSRLAATLPGIIMHTIDQSDKNDHVNVWIDYELWMFNNAVAKGGSRTSLLLLWDGTGEGRRNACKWARSHCLRITILDTRRLL
jgi:hypothetical protein